MKKINYYYFVAGFLAILFSITHELNGQPVLLPALYTGELDITTVTTFKYIWHIITAENFVFGIMFIIMAFYKKQEQVRFAAWLICVILLIRLFVIVITTLMMGGKMDNLGIDIIAIIVYTTIILLGTRAGNRIKVNG